MSIKVRNNEIKVIKGTVPIRSIMLGETCIYGKSLSPYKLSYPATPVGAGVTISVNNNIVLTNPATEGFIGVAEDDLVEVRVFGLSNYMNPTSSLITTDGLISGDDFVVYVNDTVAINRATQYSFIVNSNSVLSIDAPEKAPKVSIQVSKDEGVDNFSFTYQNSPYEFAFESDAKFMPQKISKTFASNSVEMYYGSCINLSDIQYVCNEGYKSDSIIMDYNGTIINNNQCIVDNQCAVTIRTIKGKRVTITCPALTSGVQSYRLTMIKSDFSRVYNPSSIFFEGTPFETTISTRTLNNISYYFYEGDVIELDATRNEGYKYPTLGKYEVSQLTSTNVHVTLTGNTRLVVKSGEEGRVINLVNNPLITGEYVLMDVKSEYGPPTNKARNPKIYVGDTISIPLDPQYRIGTINNRKPGVGISDGENTICSVTFTSNLKYKVQSSKVCIVLEQGADRYYSSSYEPQLILSVTGTGTTSTKQYGETGILSTICPEQNYGPECFFLSTLKIAFSTKRYLGDLITSKYNKHEYYNPPTPFSYSCVDNNGTTRSGVVQGSYTVSNDMSYLTVNITEYNKNWVANTTDCVKFYSNQIFI